jgi:hypothetical protein
LISTSVDHLFANFFLIVHTLNYHAHTFVDFSINFQATSFNNDKRKNWGFLSFASNQDGEKMNYTIGKGVLIENAN